VHLRHGRSGLCAKDFVGWPEGEERVRFGQEFEDGEGVVDLDCGGKGEGCEEGDEAGVGVGFHL